MTVAKQNCSIYPSSIGSTIAVKKKMQHTSYYYIRIVEPRKTFCSIYPSSIVEGQHMYRQEEDGLITPDS